MRYFDKLFFSAKKSRYYNTKKHEMRYSNSEMNRVIVFQQTSLY